VKLKNLLFNDDVFLNDYLDFYWYWLGAGKRVGGLSGNPTAQKKSNNLYEKYSDYIDVYRFEDFMFNVCKRHVDELDKEYPELKEFERTKLYDIKSAPLLFDKMKKFLNSKGTEVVKKYLIQK
jgi:hypothetical protein